MDDGQRISEATLTSDDGVQVTSGPLFVPPVLDVVEPTPPNINAPLLGNVITVADPVGAGMLELTEMIPPHDQPGGGGISSTGLVSALSAETSPTHRGDSSDSRSSCSHTPPQAVPPLAWKAAPHNRQYFVGDTTPPGINTPHSSFKSGPSSVDSEGRVLATHAQMAVDLDDYAQQAQRYFSLGGNQPQWVTSSGNNNNSGFVVNGSGASSGGIPAGTTSHTSSLVIAGGPGLYSSHNRTASSSNSSSAGGAAAGAMTAHQHQQQPNAVVSPTQQRRVTPTSNAVPPHGTHTPPQTGSSTQLDDSVDVASTTSTEDDLMLRYKAERLEKIMAGGGRDSMGALDGDSSFGGGGGGGGSLTRRSRSASTTRRSVSAMNTHAPSSSSNWMGAGLTTEMAENLRKLEQFAAGLESSKRGKPGASNAAAGAHDDAVRIAPLDRARMIRVLRCKKTLADAKKACVKLSSLVDRLGLSLMTYDDVVSVLNYNCMVVPEGVRTTPDDANILYIQAGRLPMIGEANMDATQIARAAIFLIEAQYTANENWSIIVDSAGMTANKWQHFSSTLGLLKDFLVDCYPVRIKNIFVHRLPRGRGPSSVAAGVLLTALEVRYLPSKIRKRLKYITRLGSVVDEHQFAAAVRMVGIDPYFSV